MKKSPSLFFPLALIAAGGLWLMAQMNIFPMENFLALTRIWPFVLIVLGLGLILQSLWREHVGMWVSVLIVVGAVLAVLYAPKLGWNKVPAHLTGSDDVTGAVAGSGSIKKETRSLEEFDSIDLFYPAEVLILQGKSETIEIEADENLLPQLEAKISGGVLSIVNREKDWSKRVQPSNTVKMTITVKDLQKITFATAGSLRVEELKSDSLLIELLGAGDIELIGLKADRLECGLRGAGNIRAAGEINRVSIQIDGFGDFNGKDLQSRSADVMINGAGSVALTVTELLDAEINGAGSVNYYGAPAVVNKNINGAGSVNAAEK